MLDPLEPVLRELIEEWPEIKAPRVTEILRDDYGYDGSVDLVRKRLALLRPRRGAAGAADGLSAGAGAAGRLGARCRPGRRIAGRERRVYALICSLPFSGAATAHFTLRHDDRVVPGGPRPRVRRGWAAFRASASTTTCASAVARRERVDGREVITGTRGSRSCAAITPFTRTPARPRRRARRARSRARSATTRPGSGRRGASRRLAELDELYAGWRDRVALPRRHATGRHIVAERLAHEREQLRPLPPVAFDAAGRRSSRVPLDGYLEVRPLLLPRARRRWSISASSCAGTATGSGSSTTATRVADYERSYEHGHLAAGAAGCAPSRRRSRS